MDFNNQKYVCPNTMEQDSMVFVHMSSACILFVGKLSLRNKFIIGSNFIHLIRTEIGAYYTGRSKPESKTPIQYTNAYIWNLERW